MLDYIVTLLSGQPMNGLDYGAVGGFMVYRLLPEDTLTKMYQSSLSVSVL